jgi:uncharacterized protein YkwD
MKLDRRFTVLSAALVLAIVTLPGCPPPDDPPDDNTPPTAEILQLELDAFNLVNAERVAEGLAALTMDEDIRAVARAHSRDMVDREFFDHINPDGDGPGERLDDANIDFSVAGENLAFNLGFADPAATAVDGWMNSQGHRDNILTGGFTHTGMGVAKDSEGGLFFTQLFITEAKVGIARVEIILTGPIAIVAD